MEVFRGSSGAGGGGGRSANPIWDENNRNGQITLQDTALFQTNVTNKYDEFVQMVRLDNLWPKFVRLKVLNQVNEDRVKAERISLDKVYRLMQILESSRSWRFHAFLKALCEDDQDNCITLIGLDAATYK